MVVYEKKAYTNDEYISHKNKIVQLYFIVGVSRGYTDHHQGRGQQ